MRATHFAWVSIALILMGSSVQAGIYNPTEPDEGPLDPVYVGKFGLTLNFLASIAAPKVEADSPLRMRYFFAERLFDKLDPGKLSAEEKLHFSAVLLRRRRALDAITLLNSATRQHPDVFLLQANLATAYHQNGELAKARDSLMDCLDAWPKEWHALTDAQRDFLMRLGWNEAPYAFYRDVETYYLKLLRLRSKEKGANFEEVDAIFGDVKFVNEAGEFEPGKIAKAEKAKLPRNARDIVQQLLVWHPSDLRLLWLLGELLNASGEARDIKAARGIFDDLVYNRNVRAKELMTRRQVLNNWVEPAQTTDTGNPFDDGKNQPASSPAVDWRGLGIAFLAGMAVAVFGHWQIREWRRRRLPKS